MRILNTTAVLLALAAAAPALSEDAFKVVANAEVAAESVTRSQLSDLFLKRATSWPDGSKAVPVDLGEDSKAFEAFCKAVHGKPGSLIRTFWKRVEATGRETPPAVRGSDADVLAFVRATRGAVGYVSAGADAAGVKVLRLGN